MFDNITFESINLNLKSYPFQIIKEDDQVSKIIYKVPIIINNINKGTTDIIKTFIRNESNEIIKIKLEGPLLPSNVTNKEFKNTKVISRSNDKLDITYKME